MGDLSVGGDFALRDLSGDVVDILVGRHGEDYSISIEVGESSDGFGGADA
jgi:hypothetical protein